MIKQIVETVQDTLHNHGTRMIGLGPAIPFNAAYFREISQITKKILFVDGGNAELLSGPHFSLQFCRVGHVIYDQKRIERGAKEFYLLVKAVPEAEKLVYSVQCLGWNQQFPRVSVTDPTFSGVGTPVSPSAVGGHCRRLAELMYAKSLLGKADILVLDGDLESAKAGEAALLEELRLESLQSTTAIERKEKSCRLFTETGHALSATLEALGPKKCWCYYPLADRIPALSFVKLHERSRYIFKIECFDTKHFEEIAAALLENSRDPQFLGYPYGLIDVDHLVRVRDDEKVYLQTKIKMQLKGLEASERALNAHDHF